MQTKQILAIAVVVIVIVAAIGVVALTQDDSNESYRSTNSDCRLQILGNADEDDYLDERDVEKIRSMVTNGEYSQMADANNDGVVSEADAIFVENILDTRANNQGKNLEDKEKISINYISVDNEILSATYPVGKIVIVNSQRALEIAIALGVDDRVVGATIQDLLAYWDDAEYSGLEDIVDVGVRKEPDLELIAGLDADSIYAGQKSKCIVNTSGDYVGNKQILRLPTWENGGIEAAALTIGFLMDVDEAAQEYVKWMDDLNKEVQEKLADVDTSSVSFLCMSSPTAMAVQTDGVSSALDNIGAVNVGNKIIVDTNTSYGKTSDYQEDIAQEDPDYIIFASYIMSQMTDAEIQAKYDDRSSEWSQYFGITSAYKNGNIIMIDYGNPFCLITLIGASIMFEDVFSEEYVLDKVQEYIDKFTNAPDDFVVQYSHIVYHP